MERLQSAVRVKNLHDKPQQWLGQDTRGPVQASTITETSPQVGQQRAQHQIHGGDLGGDGAEHLEDVVADRHRIHCRGIEIEEGCHLVAVTVT